MNKPFVKLFTACSNYYLYDVYSNSVLKLEKSVFDDISNYLKYNIIPRNIDTINSLVKEGYLQEKQTINIRHILTDTSVDYLDSLVANPILQVTQNCNFRCQYCNYSGSGKFDRQHNKKHMSWEIAKKSLDFCFEKSKFSTNFTLSFYGGEPLLEYKLLRKCIQYTNEKLFGKNIKYNMTTNFSILTDEILDFLIKYKVYITVSIDGNAETHDKNRKMAIDGSGTHSIIINNLQALRNKNLEYFLECVQINCVWDLENNYDDLLEFFSDDLFNGIQVVISPVDNRRNENSYVLTQSNIKQSYRRATMSILKGVGLYKAPVNGDTLWWYKYNLFNRKIFRIHEIPMEYHHNGPCVPGYRRLFIDVNGDFLPCEKVSNNSDSLCIGNIYNGFDFKKIISFLNLGKLTEDECQNCWAMHFCDICLAHVENEKGISRITKLNRCDYVKRQALYDLKENTIMLELGMPKGGYVYET